MKFEKKLTKSDMQVKGQKFGRLKMPREQFTKYYEPFWHERMYVLHNLVKDITGIGILGGTGGGSVATSSRKMDGFVVSGNYLLNLV